MKIYKHEFPDATSYISNLYTFSRASRASSLLFMKTTSYILCFTKQHATKLTEAKRKFMHSMMRKPLYFC